MATTDGLTSYPVADGSISGPLRLKEGLGVITLTGDLTITERHANRLRIDPGAARTVTLPAEATSAGLWYHIVNFANAAETITVKDDAANTIVSLPQNKQAMVMCDGSQWYHLGVVTHSLT